MLHIDLFSGIGGFSLAADTVWPGIEHTFCDNEPFAQAVLKKHWPNSYIHDDIRTFTYATYQQQCGTSERQQDKNDTFTPRPFILTGGFPCQPFSNAGRRKGTEDDRHLWPEMLRVIREFKPQWVIGENVAGFVTWSDGMVLRQVLADLEGEGYEVQAFIIPAVAVNAPHRRDRIWIVANRQCEGLQERQEEHGAQFQRAIGEDRNGDATDGKSKRRRKGGKTGAELGRNEATFAERQRHSWGEDWPTVATRLCRVDDGLPRSLDRSKRLKAPGNAIVPQVAIQIMQSIKEISDLYH